MIDDDEKEALRKEMTLKLHETKLIEKRFTGSIEFHCHEGKILKIKKQEYILK